jgi:thiamine transporter
MSVFATPYVDEWGDTTYQLTTAGYTALVIVMLAVLLLGCAIFGGKKRFSAKQLAFSAMAIALATATSMIKFLELPMDGSITLCSMLFIVLIGYWYGLGAGLTSAITYGILQLIIGPYIISIPQMLLDYIFAFGALGLSGIFYKSKSKFSLIFCYLVAVLGRYFFAFLSGYIFFGIYASYYGFNSEVLYSLAYNGAYIIPEAILTLIVIAIPPVNKALAYVKTLAQN